MKTTNTRPRTGSLSKEELLDYFERGYNTAAKRYLAKRWDIKAKNDTDILRYLFSSDHIKASVPDLSDAQRAILATFLEKGGRARGENIRRELLLKGHHGSELIIRELVQLGILIPLPNPGESDLDIEPLLDTSNIYLQRELVVLEPLIEILGPLNEMGSTATAAAWDGDVDVKLKGSPFPLELNLLHLTSLLLHEQLRLNKSGTPNRRSLSRFARGIALPGFTGEANEELDLNDTFQMDYLAFLLAMALELGILVRHEKSIVTDGAKMAKFFTAPTVERDRILAHVIQNLKFWSEVQSNDLSRSIEEAERQLSQSAPTGEPLIPARGYLFSLLKRSQLGEWTSIKQINDLALTLDGDFLPSTLNTVISTTTGSPITPHEFINAIIHRLMYWTGIVEIGDAKSDEHTIEVVRFTPRGRRMLGMSHDEPIVEPKITKGCVIVQPNKEIILFLAMAPLTLAFEIYQIAERQKLSNQIAHFSMSSETVQRGYAYGSNAESIIKTLREASNTPIPESIIFELEDWERIHRRQRIYSNGVLIRHSSADALDLIIGQLKYENRNKPDVEIIILGPTSAFVTSHDAEGLDKILETDRPFLIDYLGDIPPQFSFVDPLVIMLQPIELDIVTQGELNTFAERQDEKLGDSEFWELKVPKIKKRWPQNTLQNIVSFLDERCEGGLPASQYITLKSQLESAPEGRIVRNRCIFEVDKVEDADIIAKVEDLSRALERRLGPTAFLISEGDASLVEEVLDELGIKFTS